MSSKLLRWGSTVILGLSIANSLVKHDAGNTNAKSNGATEENHSYDSRHAHSQTGDLVVSLPSVTDTASAYTLEDTLHNGSGAIPAKRRPQPQPAVSNPHSDEQAVANEGPSAKISRSDEQPTSLDAWSEPRGLCASSRLADLENIRSTAQQNFERVSIQGVKLNTSRSVDSHVLGTIAKSLRRAEGLSTELLGFTPSRPKVYVYGSVKSLRSTACISSSVVAYYDGDIHLSGEVIRSPNEIEESTIHEYFHHALLSVNVHRPHWLQEGLAMYAADEQWWNMPELRLSQRLQEQRLPFHRMVGTVLHTGDEAFALALYYQSYRMVDFLVWLHGEVVIAKLVDELAHQVTTPSKAFEQAAGVTGDKLEALWDEYLATR